MESIVRKMEKKDCRDVSHVVTVAWNETYKNIVSDDFLQNLYENEEERANYSFHKFDEEDNHQFVLEVDHKIVGFVKVGFTDDVEYKDCGELHAIYLLDEYKGNGYGKKLFETGVDELKKMGYNKMIIGCLTKNKSNEFYKHMGGLLVKTRVFTKLNLPENVYLFENI